MAQGLSSLLGGLAQGFTDLGKSTLDVLGGGTTNNVITAGLDALINKKSYGQAVKDANQRQKDFRKWLYETDSDKDAAAKGLGTALNGAQTAIDLIPGLGQSAPVNAIQGAIGGLADEFKFNGENYDWGKGAQRAAVGAGAGLAAGGLGKALANSGSKVLSNGVLKGAATGSLGGALSQAGGTAIEGGNADQILQSAAQGAQFGALLGAGTGGVQSLAGALKKTRARNNAPAIMDEEVVMAELAPDYSNRIAEAQAELENIGPVSLFAKDADSQAKRARIMELNDNIKAWQNGYENAVDYSAAQEAKRANRKPYEAPEAKYQPRMGETTLDAAPVQEGYTRLYRGLENDFDPKYLPSVDDNPFGYESWTDNYNLAKQYGNNVYSVDVPTSRIANQVVTADGERVPVVKTTKKAGLNGVDGVEYMLNANDPLRQELEYKRIIEAPANDVMAELAPGQNDFFRDSVLRGQDGRLIPVYHSSPNKFTAFDDSKLGSNTAYSNTAFGHFVTPDIDFSKRFADIDGNGTSGNTMELYANIKKPITHPYNADYKYKGAELDDIVENYYKAVGDTETLNYLKEAAQDGGTSLYEAYVDNMDMDYDPFENAKWDRDALIRNGYDAVEMVEGLKSGLVDGSTDNTPVSSYAVFNSNQLKDVNNLNPTNNADVMAERVAPGQLGLFDQTATKTPETGYSQLGLFDTPTKPKTVDVADVNPYAPVNGKVTQTMLDRASETLKNYKKGTPDNDLYNRIDPETLPSGYKELRELLDNSGDFIKQRIGAEDIKKASPEKVAAYLYPEGTTDYNRTIRDLEFAKDTKTKFGKDIFKDIENRVKNRITKDVRGQLGEQAELSPEIRRNLSLYGLGNISFRDGYTAAADNAISERLGIAPGNTLKYNGAKDTGRGVLGRYKTKSRNIAAAKSGDPEQVLSTVAHERLHSFQNEAEKFAAADKRKGSGYDKEVIDAYNELSDSLKDSKLGWAQMREIGQKLGRRDADLPYYSDANEQEARMLQQYLHDKGYTNAIDTALGEKMGQPKEFNTDYYPAFDKFFDKLRELSKKGVALPAILAALGLGEYATENQEEDKDNGQQI